MRPFFAFALLFFAGCGQSPNSEANHSTAMETELQVVELFLRNHYESAISAGIPLVIDSKLSIEMLVDESHDEFARSLLSAESEEVPADLINDFCAQNATPQKLWPELSTRIHLVELSEDEMDSIFKIEKNGKVDGWKKFYSKYPKSPGVITLSRVGFNKQRDKALLYVGSQSHWLAGKGAIYVFRKENGKWIEVPMTVGSSWVS